MKAHTFIGEKRLTAQRGLTEGKYLPKAKTSVVCINGDAVGLISHLGTFIGGIFLAPNAKALASGASLSLLL